MIGACCADRLHNSFITTECECSDRKSKFLDNVVSLVSEGHYIEFECYYITPFLLSADDNKMRAWRML